METSVLPPKGPEQVTAASLRTPCGIRDLPPEVLLTIFEFFDVEQLDGTISPVCRLWRDLSRRPCVRLKLVLKGVFGLDTATACRLLLSCPNLKDLSIIGRMDTNCLLHHVSLYNHRLRRLVVKQCTISRSKYYLSEQVLKEVFLRSPHLVKLVIKWISFRDKNIFRELFVLLPELRRINLDGIVFPKTESLATIAVHCRKLEDIRTEWFGNYVSRCSDKTVCVWAQFLHGALKVLKTDGHRLSDEGFAALGQFCQLRKLRIRNPFKVTDNGVSHLSRLQNLETLFIVQARMVTSSGWVRLFSESHWKQMKNLTLMYCDSVNDDALQHVSSACPNLVKLDLTGCKYITDKGLVCVFQSCTNLEYLQISEVKSKFIFRSFSCIPLYTRNLKLLRYNSCGLKEENRVLKVLKDSLPNLRII